MSDRASSAAQPELFYASVLDEAELLAAMRVDGIDEEIAALRIKLRTALGASAGDLALMEKFIALIVRGVATRYRISPKSKRELAETMATLVEQVAGQFFPDRMNSEV